MNRENSTLNVPFCGEMKEGKHCLTVRVYYADTDFSGVVYHARYLEFFERGRSEFLRLHDINTDAAIAWIVRRMSLDFSAPARFDDVLRVETMIAQIKPARILMTQQIFRAHKLLVCANVEVALVNKQGRARRLPSDLISAFS